MNEIDAPGACGLRRRTLLARGTTAGLGGLLGLGAVSAHAQTGAPVKLVVPYGPGGSTDQVARFLAEYLRTDLGQTFVIENKPGANTAIGSAQVASAAPDGQTLLLASGASMVLNPLLYRKLTYDVRNLTLVALLANMPLVVLVGNDVPARSVAELVQLAKASPGKLNFASVGIGNPLHLAVELFMAQAGVQMTHVPYNGSPPALNAMLAGDVQVMFDVTSTAIPQIKAGKLRALAVTSAQRFPLLPDLPTLAESGLPGYDAGIWFGIAVPSGMTPDRQAALNRAVGKALSDPAFRQRVEVTGVALQPPRSIADVQAFARQDSDRWRELVQRKQIVLD